VVHWANQRENNSQIARVGFEKDSRLDVEEMKERRAKAIGASLCTAATPLSFVLPILFHRPVLGRGILAVALLLYCNELLSLPVRCESERTATDRLKVVGSGTSLPPIDFDRRPDPNG
jgi:hypothetical protein